LAGGQGFENLMFAVLVLAMWSRVVLLEQGSVDLVCLFVQITGHFVTFFNFHHFWESLRADIHMLGAAGVETAPNPVRHAHHFFGRQ
jgi:hypothetical protein